MRRHDIIIDDWSPEHVARRLAEHVATDPSDLLVNKRAAVAAVLRWHGPEPEVLLMRRVAREGDRWSGHVSFPGGGAEPADRDLLATAIRETHEELGLDLTTTARVLGRLDGLRAMAKGRVLPMSITPWVFLQEIDAPIVTGDEAEEAFWLPLAPAARGEFNAVHEYRAGPLALDLPCWRYEGRVVWGLTYEMLGGFLRVVAGT